MRNQQSGFNVRVRLTEAEGHEIHQITLRENRSQSSAISVLLREALQHRRSAAVENEALLRQGMETRLVNLIKGVTNTGTPT